MPEPIAPEVPPAAPAPEMPPAPVVETPAPVPPVEPPKRADSAGFAAMAKKEAALVSEKREIKAAQAQLEKDRAGLAEQKALYERMEKARAEAKRDPLAYLEAAGLTYEQATEFYVNGRKPTPALEQSALKDELAQLRAEQAQIKKDAEDREAARAEAEQKRLEDSRSQSVREFERGVVDFVTKAGEKYELVNLYGQQKAVAELIKQHHASTQRIMDAAEAAELVEKQIVATLDKAKAAKKLQPKAPPPPPTGEPKPEPSSAKPRTLTNDLSATTPGSVSVETDPMKRALAFLEAASAQQK